MYKTTSITAPGSRTAQTVNSAAAARTAITPRNNPSILSHALLRTASISRLRAACVRRRSNDPTHARISDVSVAPLAEAYDECERLARAHYENFPVASRLLPAAMRPHVAAIYAFARVADDLADEGDAGPDERRRRLRDWQQRLHRAVAVPATEPPAKPPADDREELMLRATAHSIRSLDLPLGLFDDLVSAFGQDIMTTRYDSWADVLDYCRRSANPIGRLMLRVAGYHRRATRSIIGTHCARRFSSTNFWQDLGRDWGIGRLYVPGRGQRAPRGAARGFDLGRPASHRRLGAGDRALRGRSRASASRRGARCATASAAA